MPKKGIEVWKDVEGYENLYKISDKGRLKRFVNGRYYLSHFNKNPKYQFYIRTILRKDKITKSVSIHRLVAQAFIPNPENKLVVNHKDANIINNKLENLEWCTPKENVEWARKLGRLGYQRYPEKYYKIYENK